MKIRSILGALVIAALPFTSVWAENMTPEDIKKLVDEAVNKRMQEHERRESPMERAMEKKEEQSGAVQYPVPIGPIVDIRVGRPGEEKVPLGFSSTGSGKLIYAKPFLSAPKATIGGYVDVMYNNLSRQNLDNPSRHSFGQQRLVPFIYADITDHIKFATEIEFERGATNAPQQGDGSMSIEFAQIDYLVNEPINLRAGLLLMPVGKFNLLHDSPLNDLVDRPMVSRIIIPSTWFEAGAGIYGNLYPSSQSKLDYEVYAVNGMSQQTGGTGSITDLGVRNARGSVSRDRDDNKAVVGRLAFSPILGIEVAGSGYHGTYKPSTATVGTGRISIFALDWTLQKGPFEIIGESAWARISNNDATGVAGSGIGPAGMQGYYIQGNYHFMPEFLKKLAPSHFTDASTFTAVVRWEQVDTDTDDRTKTTLNGAGNRRELERLTFGLNFRPIEDTVFKFDWQFNTQQNANGLAPAGDFSTANSAPLNGNGFLIQAATYF
jgi:Phosphate-selective porin O and P